MSYCQSCADSERKLRELTAEVEALRRDAERVAFLDTVSVAIHARNGRRYEAGPGKARDIIDMAQRYHAARQQEAGQTVTLVPVPTTEGKE